MLRHACNDIGLGKRACPELLGDVKIEPITAHGQYETPLYGERLGPEDGLPQSCRLDGRELGLNFSHRTYSRHARERERGREGGREGEMYIYIYTQLCPALPRAGPQPVQFLVARAKVFSTARSDEGSWTRLCCALLSATGPSHRPPVLGCGDRQVDTSWTGSSLGVWSPGGDRDEF